MDPVENISRVSDGKKNKPVCNVLTEINKSSRKCKVCGEILISLMLCPGGDVFRWEGKLLPFIYNPKIVHVFTTVYVVPFALLLNFLSH